MPVELATTVLGVIAMISGAVGMRFSDEGSTKMGVSIAILLSGSAAVLSGQSFMWWKVLSVAYA